MHRILCGGQDIFQAQALGRPLVLKNALAYSQSASWTSPELQKRFGHRTE